MKAQPRTVKLVIAGASLLILATLVFAQQAFNLKALVNPTDPSGIVLSSALSALVFLVTLVFAFVLLRTIVKVWMERRQQLPGAKFKTGLLIRLVALTLLPATCMFAFSYGLLNRSIDKWFKLRSFTRKEFNLSSKRERYNKNIGKQDRRIKTKPPYWL